MRSRDRVKRQEKQIQKGRRRQVSDLREITDEEVIAICCADVHLSSRPPVWRSAESDWFEAMARPWKEINYLADQFQCPVLCAGDIFDRWNSNAELINFALKTLPDKMICIAGQHDLPDHNYDDLNKSAYATLIEAGKIQNILPGARLLSDSMIVHSFPFGSPLTPNPLDMRKLLHVAIIHDYLWIKGHSYPNAPTDKMLQCKSFKNSKWMGYDVVIYGDNHKGFLTHMGETPVFNCGGLTRRKSDEVDYIPQVGLLTKSGNIVPYYLESISEDKYIKPEAMPAVQDAIDLGTFFAELEKLGDTALNFSDAIERFLAKESVPKAVADILRKGMELL